MKKLLVCLTVAAFAMITSSQAGEQSTKDKAAGTSEKASCTSEKAACSASTGKSCCAAGKTAKSTKNNAGVKGATLLVLR